LSKHGLLLLVDRYNCVLLVNLLLRLSTSCCLWCFVCVQNHKARDKAVRFRVCQLINRLFQNLGDDAAIDDSLYEEVYSAMQIRLRDKFPVVRLHAVLALARLQDPSDPNCPIVAGLFAFVLV